MKFIARWAFRLAVFAVVLAVGLLLLKDTLLRELAQRAIRQQTGLETRIARLECRLLSPVLALEGVRVYYPAQFGGAALLEVPELDLEYDGAAVLRRQLHLRLVRLRVAELTVVQDATGRSSLDLARRLWGQVARPGELGGWRFGGIDTLNLSLERIRLLSLKTPDRPEVIQLRLQNQIYTNLRTEQELQATLDRLVLQVVLERLTNRLATSVVSPIPASPGRLP